MVKFPKSGSVPQFGKPTFLIVSASHAPFEERPP
jgi:hypothetical protein